MAEDEEQRRQREIERERAERTVSRAKGQGFGLFGRQTQLEWDDGCGPRGDEEGEHRKDEGQHLTGEYRTKSGARYPANESRLG